MSIFAGRGGLKGGFGDIFTLPVFGEWRGNRAFCTSMPRARRFFDPEPGGPCGLCRPEMAGDISPADHAGENRI